MPQSKIQGKFYPLTSDVTAILRQAKLTAAEWRIWSYLVEVEPWGDRYKNLDSLDVMSKCDCSRATFYRAIAKLQKIGIFDIQDKGLCIRNLTGASKLKSSHGADNDEKLKKDDLKNEKVVSKMRLDSQNCESDLKNEKVVSKMRLDSQNCDNQSPKPPPDKAFETPQTLQTYSDFKQTLSESERENFLKFVEDKTKNLEKPINDLEAWLASKNAANQNRWEVYHEKFKIEGTDKNALQKELEAKQRAIAYFQNRHNVKNEEIKGNKLENQENRVEAQSKPIGEGRAIADFTKRNNPKNAEIEPKNPNLEQNNAEALEKAEIKLRAIAEFQKRMKINQPVPEPEEINSEEYRQKRAAFDELLSSVLGEKKESLAQQYREARAEAKRQQQELARQRREAAAKYNEQQDPELQRRREIKLREIEEFILRDSQRRNSERTSEKPENE